MRVMVDLDGCVYQWSRTARYLLRRWYRDAGLAHPIGLDTESTYYDYVKDVLLEDEIAGKEAWRWLWDKDGGIARGLFRDGHIYTGASEALTSMHENGHTIVIVTKRPPQARVDTFAFLSYKRWPIDEVHFMHRRDDQKSVVQCDVYIDDSSDVLLDLKENTDGYVIAMDRPWNAHAVCDYRARSWDEVTDVIAAFTHQAG